MTITYQPRGVCSQKMIIQIEDDVIQNVEVHGGCSGNLKGICILLEGMRVSDAVSRLKGIRCGGKASSCPDQLACALENIK